MAGGMPTRAEQYRHDQERKPTGKPRKAKKPTTNRRTDQEGNPLHPNKRAAKKMGVKLEPRSAANKASRRSTRKGNNRGKFDTNLEARDARARGTPEVKARKAAVKRKAARAR